MPLAPVEKKMWEKTPSQSGTKKSEGEINNKYESGEKRILMYS